MTKKNATRQDMAKEEIEAAEKQSFAMELRKLGFTYEEIAKKVGYASRGAAHTAVQSGLQKIITEGGEELLALERERVESMWLGIFPVACKGNIDAIDTCLKLMDKRARLHGLDATIAKLPEQHLHLHGLGSLPFSTDIAALSTEEINLLYKLTGGPSADVIEIGE